MSGDDILPESKDVTPAERKTVLIVDDQADLLVVMSRIIQSFGYVTHSAGGIGEALAVARSQRLDLLVSDLSLEDGSGLDLVRQIQLIQPVPAIALSGFDDPEDIRQSHEAGFSQHVRKPVDLITFEKVIKTALAGANP